MDIKKLIDAMSPEERKLASSYLWEFTKKEATEEAKKIVLLDHEEELIKQGRKVDAIRSVKMRTGCDLLVAKEVVDLYDNKYSI